MVELQNVLGFPFSISRKLLTSDSGSSPTGDEHMKSNANSYLNKATLESGLLVILLIFLCSITIALALTLLLRCLRCCRRRMALRSSNRATSTGVQKAVLKALPIIVYTATSKLPPPLPTDCPICLAQLAYGEKMRVLPKCNHGFHVRCIDKWFVSHSSCPMCRHSLNLQSGNKKPGAAAIIQTTESNNSMDIVMEATETSQAVGVVSPHTETVEGAL